MLVPALCSPFGSLADVAWVFRDLDRGPELRERVLDATPVRSPWNDAATAILDGDLVTAGDTIERIGHPASAAYTRYRAADDGERAKAAPFLELAGITSFPLPARPLGAESAA